MHMTAPHGGPKVCRRVVHQVAVTPIGGPTVVLDVGGLRLLVDPTFDPPGSYQIGLRTLMKTEGPAWAAEEVGPVAAVLLSHDQHPDNLDIAGRRFLASASVVLTTAAAAERLGGRARALPTWASTELVRPGGGSLRITGVPAQHGPDGTEHLTGPVTGFMLSGDDLPTIYVSGDNASLQVVRTIAGRCGPIDLAVLFAGAATSALLGDAHLTLSSPAAAEAAVLLGRPRVIVVHTDGWSHFTQGAATLPKAFADAEAGDLLIPTKPGATVSM